MKRKHFQIIFIIMAMTLLCLTGCKKDNTAEQDEAMQEAIDEAVEEALKDRDEKEEGSEVVSEETDVEDSEFEYKDTEEEGDFSFSEIANLEFWFSSGAGAWSTMIAVDENGAFYGSYQDTDMGESGAKYPNGTIYYSDFTGQLSEPIKMNDNTYLVDVISIEYAKDIGYTEIIDDMQHVFTMPSGIAEGDNLHIYTPGATLAELPEYFLFFVGYSDLSQTTDTNLPFYGIYDVNEEAGFMGYEAIEESSDTPSVDERIASDELTEQEINKRLEKDDITQSEMNEVAVDIYQLWDDELNWIWGELEVMLDSETMESLRIEQRDWIKKKENEMKEAGLEFEGGTMQPLIEATTGAEMTKKRVYELAAYLR